jgi:hypothetical protein
MEFITVYTTGYIEGCEGNICNRTEYRGTFEVKPLIKLREKKNRNLNRTGYKSPEN